MGEMIGSLLDSATGIGWQVAQWAFWLIDLIPFGWATIGIVLGVILTAVLLYVAMERLILLWENDELTTEWKLIALIGAAPFFLANACCAILAGAFIYGGRFPRYLDKEFFLSPLTQRLVNTETGWRFRRAVGVGRFLNVIDKTHITFPTATEKVAALGEN